MAARAGLRDGERALRDTHLSRATAGRAGLRLAAGARAASLAGFDDAWALTVGTKSFDGSKVFLQLNGADVEAIKS